MWTVEYIGFLQAVKRSFPYEAHAIQWARQVGVYGTAKIYKLNEANERKNHDRLNSNLDSSNRNTC